MFLASKLQNTLPSSVLLTAIRIRCRLNHTCFQIEFCLSFRPSYREACLIQSMWRSIDWIVLSRQNQNSQRRIFQSWRVWQRLTSDEWLDGVIHRLSVTPTTSMVCPLLLSIAPLKSSGLFHGGYYGTGTKVPSSQPLKKTQKHHSDYRTTYYRISSRSIYIWQQRRSWLFHASTTRRHTVIAMAALAILLDCSSGGGYNNCSNHPNNHISAASVVFYAIIISHSFARHVG